MINLKKATYKETWDYITENQDQDSHKLVYKGITFSTEGKIDGSDNSTIRLLVDDLEFVWGSWYSDESPRKGRAIYLQSTLHLKDIKRALAASELVAKLFGFDMDKAAEGLQLQDDTPIFDERDKKIVELETELKVYKRFAPVPDTVTYKKDQQ